MYYGVAFSPDGKKIACPGANGSVRVWDAWTAQALPGPRGHGKHSFGVAFSPDGRYLASVGGDSTLRVWDASTGQERSFPLGDGGYSGSCVTFSPQGTRIATADAEGVLRLWDTTTGRQTQIIHGHTGDALGVAFSPDGGRLASCGWDRTVKLWDITPAAAAVPLSPAEDASNRHGSAVTPTKVRQIKGTGSDRLRAFDRLDSR
jgi:WD40 repeat protein